MFLKLFRDLRFTKSQNLWLSEITNRSRKGLNSEASEIQEVRIFKTSLVNFIFRITIS